MQIIIPSIALAIVIVNFAASAAAQNPPIPKDPAVGATDTAPKQGLPRDEGSTRPSTDGEPQPSGRVPDSTAPKATVEPGAPKPSQLHPSAHSNEQTAVTPAYALPWGTGAQVSNDAATSLQRYPIPTTKDDARPAEESQIQRTYEHRFMGTLDVVNVLWRSGNGYRLFSNDDRAWRLALGFGYDVIKLPERWVIAVELGFAGEPYHGIDAPPPGSSFTGHLSATTLMFAGSVRWAFNPWLAPYGRVGFLSSRISMDFDAEAGGTSSGDTWSSSKWAQGGFLGAGVLFNLPPSNRVAPGALIEGGLCLQQDVEMRLERDLPSAAIATAGARIGTLQNTGPYLRIAAVLRF